MRLKGEEKVKDKIKIIYDDREPDFQELADINGIGIEFIRERLATGDYMTDDILFERKTIDDLAASILDGRIESQVERMDLSDRECFIIIVGNLNDRSRDINENCILGKVVSLVVKHEIKVLWCENDEQFLFLLKNVIDKSQIKLKGGDKNEV